MDTDTKFRGRVLFRGFHGPGLDPSTTKCSFATYTDSLAVAAAYAVPENETPSPGRYEPRIHAVRLNADPLVLSSDEDVMTWGEIKRLLELTEPEKMEYYLARAQIPFRRDGSLVERGNLRDDDYTDTFLLTDNPVFCARVAELEYFALAYRGTFVSEHYLDAFPSDLDRGSFRADDLSVMEFRPLSARSIEHIGIWEITRDSIPDALQRLNKPTPSAVGAVRETEEVAEPCCAM